MNNLKTFGEFFQEYYYISSLPREKEVKYWLINKYRHKVSQRLLDEQKDLFVEGKEAFGFFLGNLISGADGFLNRVKTSAFENIWSQPLVLGLEHGVTFKNEKD